MNRLVFSPAGTSPSCISFSQVSVQRGTLLECFTTSVLPAIMRPCHARQLLVRSGLKSFIADARKALQNLAIGGNNGLVAHVFNSCVALPIWAPRAAKFVLGNYASNVRRGRNNML